MVIRKISKFFRLLVDDGHFTAISAICVSALPVYLFKISVPAIIHIIPFLGAEAIYSFNRYKEKKQDNLKIKKETLLREKKIFLPFFFFLILFFFWFLLYLQQLRILLFSVTILGIGLFYTLFFKEITKKMPGFKNIFVALCWSLISIFPFIFGQGVSEKITPAIILAFFIFINVVFFEIFLDFRDLDQDKKHGFSTLPVIMSGKGIFILLLILNFLSALIIFIGTILSLLPLLSYILFFSFAYNLIFLLIIAKRIKIKEYLFEFLVDFNKILWFLLIFFTSAVFYD